MKKTIIIAVVLALALVLTFNSMFSVREDQYACTVRFSQIIDTTDEAGKVRDGSNVLSVCREKR